MVERLLRADESAKRHHVKAIVISPTRELATQIFNVLTDLLAFHQDSSELLPYVQNDERRPDTTAHVVVPQLCVGGTIKAAEDLRTFLRLSPNLLIGTPGRLAELLSSPHVKTPSTFFECLVLDEADRLLDMGFQESLSRILGFLPKTRRTGLFSASVNDAVQEIIRVGLLYPHKITVRVKSLKDGSIVDKKTPASLEIKYLVTKPSEKIPAMCQILEKLEPRPQRTILFLSTCFAVKYFARVLPGLLPAGYSLIPLHGKLEPPAREKNFARFLSTTSPSILVTTDVAARGLDIPQVDLVVQLDPHTKNFIHRCGRAGRAGRKGLAVVFLHPGREEGYVQFLEVRKMPITPLTTPAVGVTEEEVSHAANKMRALAHADRDVFQMAQRAFVSWVRSFLEQQATSIFRVSDLDWADLAEGWGLLELPKMPELRGLEVDRSLGLGIDTEKIAFKDKLREKKRQAEMAEWKAAKAARAAEGVDGDDAQKAKRRKNEAWSVKHDREEVTVARREKKRRKREAEKQGKMTEQEKEEQKKLESMIEEVRKRNQVAAAPAAATAAADEFEGFDD